MTSAKQQKINKLKKTQNRPTKLRGPTNKDKAEPIPLAVAHRAVLVYAPISPDTETSSGGHQRGKKTPTHPHPLSALATP